jgi:sigma-E factor negative regulatory protein RseA
MSDLLNEQLSAFIDGELPQAETTLLMKRLAQDPELRRRLARYQASGDCLRGAGACLTPGFASRISAALEAEPPLTRNPRGAFRLGPMRVLGGLAVAASVAAAALFVLGRGTLPATPTAEIAATAPQPKQLTPPLTASRQQAAVPATLASLGQNTEPQIYVTPKEHRGLGVIPRAELTNYVVAHSEVSGPLGLRSALTGVVADDSGAPAQ